MKKERKKNLVSIVITNYNKEDYIQECLDSIVNQTYKEIEVIIIDDASTDSSVNKIEEWIESNKDKGININLFQISKNIGFSGAVTTGLYLASGEYIAMQDGDDISDPTRIEKQVNYLKNNKGIRAIGTNYAAFSNKRRRPKILPNTVMYGVEKIREAFSKGINAVTFGTILFEGEIFDEIGGLTRKADGAEDFEFVSKLLPFGLDNIKEAIYYYRSHKDQRSKEFYGGATKKRAKVSREELRVLLVLDAFNIGGTETHVLSLAKELINQGVKVVVLGKDGPLGSEFKKLNCKIYNMDFPLIVPRDRETNNAFITMIRRVIEAEKINIIHGHMAPSGSLALESGREFNIPYIMTIHGMYYHDILSDKLPKCNAIISVSHPVYTWLLKSGIQSRVIPNGIIYNDFEEKNQISIKQEVRQTYGIPDDALLAMYCSRMAWGKIRTCENLIRVVRDLKRAENIDYHALIVGDGPGYEELVEVGKRANSILGKEIIHFTGNQLDMPKFYLASDLVVGTGRVAIEGMAARKNVIATGNDGYYGIITPDNFDAAWNIYFGDHGSSEVNNAMYLYDDLKRYYSEKNNLINQIPDIYLKSKKMFDISVMTKQVIDIYLDSFK